MQRRKKEWREKRVNENQEVSSDTGEDEDDGDSLDNGDQEEETAEQILFMLFGPRIWEHDGQW